MLNGNGVEWVEWGVPVDTSVDLFALDGLARDQVWAVGAQGTVLFFDGNSWANYGLDTPHALRGVSFYGGDDYMGYPLLGVLVGDHGTIYTTTATDGRGWEPVEHSLSEATLNGVAVPKHNDAWAVGEGGTLLHFDGASWVRVHTGTEADLHAVDAYRSRALLAVGTGGTILYYHWSHEIKQALSPSGADLFAVTNLGACVFFGRELLGHGQWCRRAARST